MPNPAPSVKAWKTAIADDPGSSQAARMYAAVMPLRAVKDHPGWYRGSEGAIAERLHYSTRTVQRVHAELLARGYLQRIKRGQWSDPGSTYTLCLPKIDGYTFERNEQTAGLHFGG